VVIFPNFFQTAKYAIKNKRNKKIKIKITKNSIKEVKDIPRVQED